MEENELYEHIIDKFIDICEENGELFTDVLNYFKENINDKYKEFNSKTYYYKFVDDYEDEYSEDFILCTNKDAKELLTMIIDDIWANRNFIKEIPKEFNYNEDENEITYNGVEYKLPETYEELYAFMFDLLNDNGIKCWRPTFDTDETFLY